MTDVRESIRAVWEEALDAPVRDETDFFDAGGQSFIAARIIARLEALHAVEVPLRTLFDHSRFDEFAAVVEHLVSARSVALAEPAAEPVREREDRH